MTRETLFLPLFLAACVALSSTAAATPRDVSHSTPLEVRLAYLDNLLDSRSGQRLLQHQHAIYAEVSELFGRARQALTQNHPERADQLAREGFGKLMKALKSLPDDSEEIARLQRRYEALYQSVEKLIYAEEEARATVAEQEGEQPEGIDPEIIGRIVEKAKEDAGRKEYEKAIARLDEVYRTVTASIQGMLNNRQVVIKLDIGTPEKEYFYELRRFQGYEELIPIAIEVKKPSEMVAGMLLKARDKANWMADQAREKAIEGDYPVAIRMMMDATMEIKNALRLVGVNM